MRIPSPVACGPTVLSVAFALCLPACDGGRTHRDPSESTRLTEATYLLRGEPQKASAPAGCTPRLVAATLQGLFAEVSHSGSGPSPSAHGSPDPEQAGVGDPVRRFFGGDEAPFAWLTLNQRGVTGVPTIEARSRRELPSALNRLKLARLELELTKIGPMRWVPQRRNLDLGLIRFDMWERETRKPLGFGTGEGEYHCATRSFEVLSLMVHEELPPPADGSGVAHNGTE